MTQTLSLDEIDALARDCLRRVGVRDAIATAVAAETAAAEAMGEAQHGVSGLLRDLRLIRYGHLHPDALPILAQAKPGLLTLDAQHGFAAACLMQAVPRFSAQVRKQGIAVLRLDRASAPGALLTALTRLAQVGLCAVGYGAGGAGRVAGPDAPMPVLLSGSDRAPLHQMLDTGVVPIDDPFAGTVNHRAWIVAGETEMMGAAGMPPGLCPTTGPIPTRSEVTLTSELLEELIAA